MSDDKYKAEQVKNDDDNIVTCCRCKHVHKEGDRVKVKSRTHEFVKVFACPKCGAHSYMDGVHTKKKRAIE